MMYVLGAILILLVIAVIYIFVQMAELERNMVEILNNEDRLINLVERRQTICRARHEVNFPNSEVRYE